MSVDMGLQQPSMNQYHNSNNRVLDIEKLKDALMTSNSLVTPQNPPRKQMFNMNNDLERVAEVRKRGGSYGHLAKNKNRIDGRFSSKPRRQINRKGTIAEGVAEALRSNQMRT